MRPEVSALIEQLEHPRSPKRRAAAIKLRKLNDPAAGPALLAALERELPKEVTWETQYQLIRALGECEYRPALPLLRKLTSTDLEATMIYVAAGDAVVRLARKSNDDFEPLWELLSGNYHHDVLDGALRAAAMIPLKLSQRDAAQVLARVKTVLKDENPFWAVLACAGWSGTAVDDFLAEHEGSADPEVAKAARLARNGKYLKVNPL